jgi:arylsulfatase A-like enzyme
VVLTDTLRADSLGLYRPASSLGTALGGLAEDGIVFERAISSSSWTRTAVATLLTGLDATTHAVLERDDKLPTGVGGLPQSFRAAGYETLAWSSNPNVVPLWGFDAGVDVFTDASATAWPKEKADASAILGDVRATLARRPSAPAFLYVHLMDPHAPYRPEPADLAAIREDPAAATTFPGRTSNARAEDEYLAYLAEVRGMDRELGAFFDDLRARHLYERATILVVSDHGEEFLDHGDMRHGKTLYQEMIHVPVVLKLPGNALAGTRIAGAVGLADLAPTLLGALGLPPLGAVDGRDLWDPTTKRLRDESAPQVAALKLDTHHKAALVDDARKLILDYRATDQLFDLDADPHERHNLLPDAAADAESMRVALDARIARHESGWHVRVCGADRAEALRLRLQAAGTARGSLLEDGDALRPVEGTAAGDEIEAALDLTPRPSERVLRKGVWKGMRADEDEIVVTGAPERLVVRTTADAQVPFAAGVNDPGAAATTIVADAADPAFRVRPSDAVRCRPQPSFDADAPPPAPRPYVRVWYVVPTERVAPDQVDPAVQDRLRALGYQR